MRPAEFAQYLLVAASRPPRDRARDQQADRAGEAIRRDLLHGLIARDPDATAMEAALLALVQEQGEAAGPARGVASTILEEWRMLDRSPHFLDYLVGEAIRASEPGRRRREPAP